MYRFIADFGMISIHALREEGDVSLLTLLGIRRDFYPRPPRGGRLLRICSISMSFAFLSTPSARRATKQAETKTTKTTISIHALREEGDG